MKGLFNKKVVLQGALTAAGYWLSTLIIPAITANPNWKLVWTLVGIFVSVHIAAYVTKSMK